MNDPTEILYGSDYKWLPANKRKQLKLRPKKIKTAPQAVEEALNSGGVFRGTWAPEQKYKPGDTVINQGDGYVCIHNHGPEQKGLTDLEESLTAPKNWIKWTEWEE